MKSFGPSMVSSGTRLPRRSAFRSANGALIMIESGCARNTSGSSSIASSPAARSYSRRLRSPVMSTPRISRLPWPASRVPTTASMTGAATRTSASDCTRSSTSSSKPGSPAVICSSVAPAMRSSVSWNIASTARFAVCMATNTATPMTMPIVVRIVRVVC